MDGFHIFEIVEVDESEFPCDICGYDKPRCICPKCKKCKKKGNPKCYEDHGMEYTDTQLKAIDKWDVFIDAEIEDEKNYYRSIEEDLEVN
jgi:hypothetical protein